MPVRNLSRPVFLFFCIASVFSINLNQVIAEADSVTAEQQEFFEKKIRPVLIDHCYSCHNSSDTAEGGLILDYGNALRQGGQSGSPIDLKEPEKSLLLKVIRHEIEELEMPLGEEKLSSSIIADFEKWIGMGAPDPRKTPPATKSTKPQAGWKATLQARMKWWSFQPIENPEIPNVNQSNWSSYSIDQFILSKLKENQLAPASTADRRTLIRRLSFVLTGLPPTPAEINSFLNDQSPDAYEKVVDQYLNSSAFGEHWARHWMDLIRYSETHGSEGDPAIPNAWKYRDYLIRALNDDLPYDQFVKEHIAGDLLESPRINQSLNINESAIAPAHWRMCFHGFAPTDALDEKVRFTDDQINVFSKTFLGLTVSCARCHNHKFDPISQADYYAMFGIVGSTRPGIIDINPESVQSQFKPQLLHIKKDIRKELAKAWTASMGNFAERLRQKLTELDHTKLESRSHFLHPFHLMELNRSISSSTFRKNHEPLILPENSVHWDFNNSDHFQQWFTHGNGSAKSVALPGDFTIPEQGETVSPLLEGGVHSHLLSKKHRNVFSSPQFEVKENHEVWLRVRGDSQAMVRYVVHNYPRNGTVYPVTTLQDGKWKWQRYDLSYWDGEKIHIEISTAADSAVLAKNIDRSSFGISEVVVAPEKLFNPPQDLPVYTEVFHEGAASTFNSQDDLIERYSEAIDSALQHWGKSSATNAQVALIQGARELGLLTVPDATDLKTLLIKYREIEAKVVVPNRVPGLLETVGRDQALFIRGNHHQPGAQVPRRFLEAFDTTPYQSNRSGRLELADDILAPKNPLTSRVIVNRIWHYLFGAGLVRTVDNFGVLGEKPSHPELLDYLAIDMRSQGWSIKKMIRSIVLTKTWQLDSRGSKRTAEIDPDNRLLSHANVRRLDAEAIRDSLLATSGRLDRSLHGPPAGTATNNPRRSVYMSIRRNSLNPFLETFDAPVPFAPKGRRDSTNVPAQSLTMLNDPFVSASAQAMISKFDFQEGRHDLIQKLFERSLGRTANGQELNSATAYLVNLQQHYRKDAEARSLIVKQLSSHRSLIASTMQSVRQQLEHKEPTPVSPFEQIARPIAEWKFDQSAKDTAGHLHGELKGNAKVEDGALILDGKSYMISPPVAQNILEKSFEATVQIEDFKQRGGGVFTLQDLSGGTFDAIVLGEKDAGHWLAGSNNFARTESFQGELDDSTSAQSIHLVITYHADGTIRGFRNGKPYGKAYRKSPPIQFQAGNAQVLIGLRHAKPVGNRLLKGKVLQARLYDRALTPEEVELLASESLTGLSESAIRKAMSSEQQDSVDQANLRIEELNQQLKELGEAKPLHQAWSDLAHAIYNMKEFIYIR